MAALIQKHESRAFSSATSNGASSISADGSSFEVTLQTPLSIPAGAFDAECISVNRPGTKERPHVFRYVVELRDGVCLGMRLDGTW